jgi:catechol 2,3-dioxygenase-like lactoylglutathione lyase family enzyme
MNLVSAIHHVAMFTADIDRFIEFYTDVCEMPVIFPETTPAFCKGIGNSKRPGMVVVNRTTSALQVIGAHNLPSVEKECRDAIYRVSTWVSIDAYLIYVKPIANTNKKGDRLNTHSQA